MAHDLFVGISMEAFAEPARRELVATCERVRKRTVKTRGELAAHEVLAWRLAGRAVDPLALAVPGLAT